MPKTVTRSLYAIECAPECGFLVRNHNQPELFELAIRHCKNSHDKVVSEKDLRAGMKTVTN